MVTIQCSGNDGQPGKLGNAKQNPLDLKIINIKIFGPGLQLLHNCRTNDARQQPCYYNITGTKDLGRFTYHCQFLTVIATSGCTSSKNLTVTGHGKKNFISDLQLFGFTENLPKLLIVTRCKTKHICVTCHLCKPQYRSSTS